MLLTKDSERRLNGNRIAIDPPRTLDYGAIFAGPVLTFLGVREAKIAIAQFLPLLFYECARPVFIHTTTRGCYFSFLTACFDSLKETL